MPSILLICDDENRRAELHGILSSDFKVFATEHSSANSIRKKIKDKTDLVVLETDFLENGSYEEKIIYPTTSIFKPKYMKLLRAIIKNFKSSIKLK